MKIFIHLMEKAGRLVFQLIHVIVNNKDFFKKINQQSIKRMNQKTNYDRMLFNFLFLKKIVKEAILEQVRPSIFVC